jgi:hypothetical protein
MAETLLAAASGSTVEGDSGLRARGRGLCCRRGAKEARAGRAASGGGALVTALANISPLPPLSLSFLLWQKKQQNQGGIAWR